MAAPAGGSARPLVLVPSSASRRWEEDGPGAALQSLNQAYVSALQGAGLVPLLVTPGDAPPEDLSGFGGLLLPGGPDVEPWRYGAEPDPTTDPAPESDALEFSLLERARAQGLPVLGICRGLQLLNVGLGGSLVQDLERHPRQRDPEGGRLARDRTVHGLSLDPGSRLGQVLGTGPMRVNSMHHQGIDRLAPSLAACAWADDGLVEGVELPGDEFCLAVQYHPEELAPSDPRSRALFAAFAEACRAHLSSAPLARAR